MTIIRDGRGRYRDPDGGRWDISDRLKDENGRYSYCPAGSDSSAFNRVFVYVDGDRPSRSYVFDGLEDRGDVSSATLHHQWRAAEGVSMGVTEEAPDES